jgi:ribosomal-protein-alanine N-acetyltransferase
MTHIIETERLILKASERKDAEKVVDYYYRNKEFFKEWDPPQNGYLYAVKYQKKTMISNQILMKRGELIRFWIYKKDDLNRIIGTIALNNVVRGVFQSAFLGYKLDKDEICKGYTTEALEALIKFAFGSFNLHRIEANIISNNLASIAVVKKAGFIKEGSSKNYLWINDGWKDHDHYVLINDKWKETGEWNLLF